MTTTKPTYARTYIKCPDRKSLMALMRFLLRDVNAVGVSYNTTELSVSVVWQKPVRI